MLIIFSYMILFFKMGTCFTPFISAIYYFHLENKSIVCPSKLYFAFIDFGIQCWDAFNGWIVKQCQGHCLYYNEYLLLRDLNKLLRCTYSSLETMKLLEAVIEVLSETTITFKINCVGKITSFYYKNLYAIGPM